MEETFIVENANLNEGKIIPVMVDGELLIKLGTYQLLLQQEIDKEGIEHEISLSDTINYIITEKLDECITITEEE
jgi:hypothetical protein